MNCPNGCAIVTDKTIASILLVQTKINEYYTCPICKSIWYIVKLGETKSW